MIKLILAIIIMLYYLLFRIKSYGKLLIYSTVKSGEAERCGPINVGPAQQKLVTQSSPPPVNFFY
jgi:hypothetical protein